MVLSRASLAFLVMLLLVPLFVHAQGETDLSATIRAAILSDPRTATMSETQINSMVAALTQEAEKQGVTPQDIVWRPQEPAVEQVAALAGEGCGIMPAFFCALSAAFGLDGSDVTIPIGLGISAALLLFVIGSLLHLRHGHHPVVGNLNAGM